MNDALLSALKRRFAAQAEVLPNVLPALVSDDPASFLVRYRRDALCGLAEAPFRKLRQAAREERELHRRRQSVRRALEQAGTLSEEVGKLLETSSDAALLDDLARPVRAAKAAHDAASGAAAGARPADDPMKAVARQVIGGESATPLAELLAPFCGENGAPPTADDQRVRLVRLVADLIGEDAQLRQAVRAAARRSGELHTSLEARKETKDAYRPFADQTRPISKIPARMVLLLRRGQKAGAVRAKLTITEEERTALLAGPLAPREGHPYAELVKEAAADALDRVLVPSAMNELLKERKRAAERSLLPLFGQALRERLMLPPAGPVPVVAVVPGATGSCRIAVVDAQGRAGTTVAVHPLAPRNETEEAANALVGAIRDSGAKIVAVASSGRARATRDWVMSVLAAHKDLEAAPIPVNEAPAVALSESEADKLAAPELPATARVALSIGRLVQDPLGELLRYDLCEIPLGPNQRDVDQGELRRRLEESAEACVALVGVNVNTAPATTLARVPGLDAATAAKIVAWREKNGPFATRAAVREVEGIEEQAWQRAAGFLRIPDGLDPLDATGVHPLGAAAAAAIAAKLSAEVPAILGRPDLLAPLDPKEFAGPVLTEADVRSVLEELGLGRSDPRGSFVPPAFNPGVLRAKDLAVEMQVDGIITSLSKFGAFVDVGVGQDGLVHVSELAHEFVRDPADVVKVGQRVRVKVVGVDPVKRRISLSIKALLPVPERPAAPAEGESSRWGGRPGREAAQGDRAGGAPSGPRRGAGGPRRSRPGGPPGAAGPGDARPGPGGFSPERPGTAPRRAQRRGGRFGDSKGKEGAPDAEIDLSRDSGTGSFGSLTGGRGGGGRRFERPQRENAPRRQESRASSNDPFQQQLEALKAKLGLAPPPAPAPEPEPSAAPTDPAPSQDRPSP